jgi:hypothetical protein
LAPDKGSGSEGESTPPGAEADASTSPSMPTEATLTVVGKPPAEGNAPFVLVVDNEGHLEAMHVDIKIDDARVLSGDLGPQVTTTNKFALTAGHHTVFIVATESMSQRINEDLFEFDVTDGQPSWGLLDVLSVQCDDCLTPFFTFRAQNDPPKP